jgi:hypothetical protein
MTLAQTICDMGELRSESSAMAGAVMSAFFRSR